MILLINAKPNGDDTNDNDDDDDNDDYNDTVFPFIVYIQNHYR